LTSRRAGADPLDGTAHFSSGGSFYCVQAHFVEDGIPLCGVIFQPEVFLPLAESERCLGRLAYAMRGNGAFVERTEFDGAGFVRSAPRAVRRQVATPAKGFVACVPVGVKMRPEERDRALRIYQSDLVTVTTGLGGAGANILMAIFGGQHIYANFGAGDELDLIPGQVIALEAGLTVWGMDRRPPVWHVHKQPVIFAPDETAAERVLSAAGL
jgi:3'-phosphoadenosine 5'-phosphosulfate (PAPS) 3'-phosphatase